MKSLFKNNSGATMVEFALVAVPVFLFIMGIMQFGWTLWVDNLLHMAVDAAARCGAVNSTTSPCQGNSTAQMIQTAKTVFTPLSGATFSLNTTNCSGTGLTGTYSVDFLWNKTVYVNLTTSSCYPTVVTPAP
jgi:Flp pilus assembly protein TadG